MKQGSKRFIAITLLLCFIAPVGLTYMVLKLKQWQVREEIEQQILVGMDKGELVELTFSLEDSKKLDWEHEREFEFEGQSYDIVESEVKGDSITYFVWWDKVETKIKHQLAELVSMAMNDDEQNQENQEKIDHLFKTLYYSSDFTGEAESFISKSIKLNFLSNRYLSLAWAPPVPPPLFI